MKLSKSKLALAKVINENGGWVDGDAIFAAMDGNGDLFCYSGKPQWTVSHGHWYGHTLACWFSSPVVIKNHHQTIISREEYYQAYPEVTKQDIVDLAKSIDMIDACDNPKADADGWIEWKGCDKPPVSKGASIDVTFRDGDVACGLNAEELRWNHYDSVSDIIAYRLRKPEVKPECCESVARSIPEPESKPAIEQLAQDYRNAKDYADRLQKEAGEAAVKAEEFAVEIRKKILELQELIG